MLKFVTPLAFLFVLSALFDSLNPRLSQSPEMFPDSEMLSVTDPYSYAVPPASAEFVNGTWQVSQMYVLSNYQWSWCVAGAGAGAIIDGGSCIDLVLVL